MIAKECGTPRVRPLSPLPKVSRVSGMPFTVLESKICSPIHWKMLAVPNVMMIACTRP